MGVGGKSQRSGDCRIFADDVDGKESRQLKAKKKQNSSNLLKIIGLVRSQLRPQATPPWRQRAGALKCCTTKCE